MIIDIHIHSHYSHDSRMTIDQIISTAKKVGLDKIAITDHNEIKGAIKAFKKEPSFIIPGVEVSALEGHVICLDIKESIPYGLPAVEVIEKVHNLGGIAIAAHPYDYFREAMDDLCIELPFNAIEVNGSCINGNSRAIRMARENNKPLVGGSDAHIIRQIGLVRTKCKLNDPIESIRKGKCDFLILSKAFKINMLLNAGIKNKEMLTKKAKVRKKEHP